MRCTLLKDKADEAGLTVREWGKLNWRKVKAAEMRMTIVFSIKQLQKLSDEDLATHILSISDPILRKAVSFLVECGEPGLVREIVKYVA
jgi:S-methylmethionine-dependent homocysteine/selenocysteine methylase